MNMDQYIDRIQDVLIDFPNDNGQQRREIKFVLQDIMVATQNIEHARHLSTQSVPVQLGRHTSVKGSPIVGRGPIPTGDDLKRFSFWLLPDGTRAGP